MVGSSVRRGGRSQSFTQSTSVAGLNNNRVSVMGLQGGENLTGNVEVGSTSRLNNSLEPENPDEIPSSNSDDVILAPKRVKKVVKLAPRPPSLEPYPIGAQFCRRERAHNAPYVAKEDIRRRADVGIAAAQAIQLPADGKKKIRGPTKSDSMLPVDETQRYVLDWNSKGVPTGEEGNSLNQRIAAIAKMSEIWPLCRDWNEHNYTPFKITWRFLLEDFELHGHPNAWTYVFEKLKGFLISWSRDVLNKCYKKENNDAMRYKKLDPRVDPYQFAELMIYWESEHFQVISEINAEDVKKRKMNHRGGSRSFAEIERMMTIENNGTPPEPLDLQIRAYNPLNPKTMVPDETRKLLQDMSDLATNITQQSQEPDVDTRTKEDKQLVVIETILKPKKKNYGTRLSGVGSINRKRVTCMPPLQPVHSEKKYERMKKKVGNMQNQIDQLKQIISERFPSSNPLQTPTTEDYTSEDEYTESGDEEGTIN